MKNWRKSLITPQTSILDSLKIIDESAIGIALVVNEKNHLLGTVTDGDIRRALLRAVSLAEPVETIMNARPTAASFRDDREVIFSKMKQKEIKQIPVVDENGCVVHLAILSEMIQPVKRENWVVLMAGGLGKRLHPLTNDCPKPMLKVGDKPVLETIIENLINHGFYRFFISVNYKAEMIEDYFGDGSKWGVEIQYLREKERLGTAGALSLLPEMPNTPMIVMNGDLLTKVNFEHLLDYHHTHQADATMGVREYSFQVPYGVVQLEKHRLVGIEEKPVQQFFVSAGVYVVNPEMMTYIPPDQYFDMPTLFDRLITQGKETVVFPVREYWMDIGRIDDFEKANGEYAEVFK